MSATRSKEQDLSASVEFALFKEEDRALANALAMVEQLDEVSHGVKSLSSAYRRAVAEQKRLVRVSDRVQAELREVNSRLEKEIEQNERLMEELRLAATTDFLTGAVSRRHFVELGRQELRRCALGGKAFSAIVVDIDHFKTVNDRFGHAAGDAALVAFVEAVKRELRSGAVIGRLGGEEFSLFLEGAAVQDAAPVVERLRAAIERLRIDVEDQQVTITASFGIADLRETDLECPDPLEKLLQRADEALYRAKSTGRNRVEVAPVPDAVPQGG